MAAVLHPHRLPPETASPRPDLRVLPGGGVARPRRVRPGLPPGAVLAAVAMLVVVLGAVLGIDRGAFAGLAPAPPAASSPAAGSASAVPLPGAATVVVGEGDTIWSIARRLQPTGDLRPLVDALVAAHGSALVVPGDRIAVPR